MRLPRRQCLHLAFAALAMLAAPRSVRAQGYPDRPVRMIVPYAPGGGNDVLARAVAEPMGKSLGQPLVIAEVVAGIVLGPSLLAALVVTQSVGGKNGIVLDARLVGLGAAVVAIRLRAPLIVVVVVAALTTALVRLL